MVAPATLAPRSPLPLPLLAAVLLAAAATPPAVNAAAAGELFQWSAPSSAPALAQPAEGSDFFSRFSSLPRQDVVAQIRSVVEPVTKEALNQLTPEVVRQVSDMPRDDIMKYVMGVLEPATKTVVSGVSGIVEPAAASFRRLLEGTRTRIKGGVRVVLKPAADGLGAIAAPALDEIIYLAVDTVRMLWKRSFEPLHVEHMELHFRDPLITADLQLNDVQVNNASTFVLDSIKSEPQNMAANFTAHVEAFNVTGFYDVNGAVVNGEHKVFGGGNFTAVVRGLNIRGRVEIGIKDLFLHVNDLKLDISIEKLQVKLEGLLGDAAVADLASGVISDVGPEFLEEFRPEVGAMISGQIKDFANDILGTFTVPSILERIRQHSEETASKRLHLRNRVHLYHHQELEAEAERQRLQRHQEHADKRPES
ncbi:30S ribosomal protein S5 [Frankliniella fusca]|uniref:30S ribosomal protein S5 n=1 Tax=Frankliniella fusca TaxID=407009 RepID=A0AAE1H9P3_9NEOP|nr:30S ribosomal protein S5 [Frankliniella fusca]